MEAYISSPQEMARLSMNREPVALTEKPSIYLEAREGGIALKELP